MFVREHTEPVSSLCGVGPAFARAASRIGVCTVAGLLTSYPRDYQDRRVVVPLAQAVAQQGCVVLVTVTAHHWIGRGRKPALAVEVRDESAPARLLCFNRGFLGSALPLGARVWLYGSFSLGRRGIESASFEHESWSERPRRFLRILPVYPLTEGLTQAAMRKAVGTALAAALPSLEDELPAALVRSAGLLPKAEAMREIHYPHDPAGLDAARRTLKYEELFQLHLAVAGGSRLRAAPDRARREGRPAAPRLRDELLRRLPFELTADQLKALGEIEADLRGPIPAARLLQGDVGCGKTLVALLACLGPIANGEQAALMAPTELLSRQHAESASRLLEPLGVKVAFLSSGVAGPARRLLLEALAGGASGGVDLVIGTHALFSADVRFRRLGFAVIDEQQRFGVAQRRELAAKGGEPDLLIMTATPIPRTLALTVFGDLAVSEIRSMPLGRKPVETHLTREGNEAKVYERVRLELRKGHQAYFVYPLIQESGAVGLRDAERMFARLSKEVYPEWSCALIHSRVPEEERESRMARFAAGEIRVLVATSVVEVGVDVTNATCMVVEHADRFGLSALHQLRGRVGRGTVQSYAFLVYSRELTEAGVRRLRVMKEESDGFKIAEEDLRLRGPGAILGVEQAGYLRLGIADLATDFDLAMETREAARALLAEDPELAAPANASLRRAMALRPAEEGSAARGG